MWAESKYMSKVYFSLHIYFSNVMCYCYQQKRSSIELWNLSITASLGSWIYLWCCCISVFMRVNAISQITWHSNYSDIAITSVCENLHCYCRVSNFKNYGLIQLEFELRAPSHWKDAIILPCPALPCPSLAMAWVRFEACLNILTKYAIQ